MVETLRKLKEGKQVSIPIYNFHTHSREKQQKAIYGANVIIFEGIMAFAHKSLLELMDMKIFVDTGKDSVLLFRLCLLLYQSLTQFVSMFDIYRPLYVFSLSPLYLSNYPAIYLSI